MVTKGGKPALAQDFGVKSRAGEYARWRFLAVDPGDVHVGLAEFERKTDSNWYCVWAGEKTPNEFLPWFAEGLRKTRWEHVVVESWKLFPEAAKFYTGSDMPTSRLIGSITALAAFLPPVSDWLDEPVVVTYQDPQIKKPTRALLQRRKLQSVAKLLGVVGDHATDAELHGYKYLFDRKLPFENATQQKKRLDTEHIDLTHRHTLW